MSYFGVLSIFSSGALGRIRVLARLTRQNGVWVRERSFNLSEEIGPTGKVFVPFAPAELNPRLRDQTFVKFDIIASRRVVERGEDKDTWLVSQNRSGGWNIEPFGLQIVNEQDVSWREEPRWFRAIPRGSVVYIKARQGGKPVLIGHWEIQQTDGLALAVPSSFGTYVCSYPIEAINPLTIIGDEEVGECLLDYPSRDVAEPIDLATSTQLANWLLRKLDASKAKEVMVRLNQEYPAWRGELKGELEALQNTFDRKLELSRWERLEEIVQFLEFDYEMIQELRILQSLGERYSEALVAYETEMRQESEQHLQGLDRQIQTRQQELASLSEQIRAKQQELEQDESRLTKAADHLEASREKLAAEFLGFQSLLDTLHVGLPPSVHSVPDATFSTDGFQPVIEPLSVIESPPINSFKSFVEHRLFPALGEWLPDATLNWAKLFHHAVRACRWVLVPNPAWAIAYGRAMGGTARVMIVQVEPIWLRFSDAWSGAVEHFWTTAQKEPNYLHLLLFEDVNRALPDCWARPWLDILAGFRDSLPVEGVSTWPDNLRVLASPAPDQAALPLSQWVVQHWAAVSLTVVGQSGAPPAMHAGHVPWHQWEAWGGQIPSSVDLAIGEDFGVLASCVAHDLNRLQSSLKSTDPDLGEESIDNLARNIRIRCPLRYIENMEDE